jgi:hypothetical protein
VLRLLASPADPRVEQLRRLLRGRAHFTHLFGSGVGDEEQNLYLVASGAPLELVHPEALAIWPVPEAIEPYARPLAAAIPGAPASRRVTLLGYLVRAREDGALCLDLPHEEMGALRYRLSGEAAERLRALLPGGFEAPTAGDIRSDGDTRKTLRELLGGGGWKRSDLRFSPVIVAVRGVAKVAAIVHPDAADGVPREIRGDAPTDARLPYGGVLYDLAVEEVLFSYDRAAWQKLGQRLAPIARRAIAAAEAGDLTQAVKHGEEYLVALRGDAGDFMGRLALHAEMTLLLRSMRAEAGAAASPFTRAGACDRAHAAAGVHLMGVRADVGALHEALRRCAERGYQKARKVGSEVERKVAAGRLLVLISQRPFEARGFARDQQDIEQIRQDHPGVEAFDAPPPR